MALSYDLTRIKNKDEVCFEDGRMNVVTECLIFATMSVGLGSITEKNWKKFLARMVVLEKIDGAYAKTSDGNPHFVATPENVYSHIGLKCNVADITDAAFRKNVFEMLERDIAYSLRDFSGE